MKRSTSRVGPFAALFSCVVLATVIAAGCASTPTPAADAPLVPDQGVARATPEKNAHLDDVKKTVADQLECPVETVNMTCLRKDAQGECISVRGDGCGRTVEYQFGDV